MRSSNKASGIFCVEDVNWWGTPDKQSSVQPILDLLRQWNPHYVPFIHRDVATRAEFDCYLDQWAQKKFKKFSVLYIALHGDSGKLFLGDRRKNENMIDLDGLEDLLRDKCHGRIIYFGSCETLNLNGNRINRFLRETGALAVCGYRKSVDWLESTALDVIVLGAMQEHTMTRRGVVAMKRRIFKTGGTLAKKLGLRMEVRKSTRRVQRKKTGLSKRK